MGAMCNTTFDFTVQGSLAWFEPATLTGELARNELMECLSVAGFSRADAVRTTREMLGNGVSMIRECHSSVITRNQSTSCDV